ncbi:MAG TPA: ABC transporter permease [Bacillota bacterium]|nr:ABC transporter permease [Bacillota bacterium]
MWTIIVQIFPYAIAYTVPLLMTALGGLYSERSGVVNIGLEGLMVMGMFAGAMTITRVNAPPGTAVWIGLVAAVIAGSLFSLLHAFACVTLNANQVISGIAINMVAGSLTRFFARNVTGSGNIQIVRGIQRTNLPVLSDIPFIGPLLFRQTYATTWVALAILGASAFILYKTRYGLRLRACGENPHAADAAGVNIYRMRYSAVMISGALAGLGGGIFLTTLSGEFNGSAGGLGFLALAALIFGQWKPLGILGATFFFGLASTIANVSQAIPQLSRIPGIILKTFPFVVTLLALVAFSRTSQAPKAAGEPYDKGRR